MTCLDDLLKLCKAMKLEDMSTWKTAMQEKYDSLMANETGELAILSKDHKTIGCKWVICTKRNVAG